MAEADDVRLCENCGNAFPRWRQNRCCSAACRKERRLVYMRAYMRDYMRASVRKPTYQRVAAKKPMGVGPSRVVVCKECGISVETKTNATKVTCSTKYSQKRMNRILRKRRAAAKESHEKTPPPTGAL